MSTSLEPLLHWLRSCGARLDGLDFRASAHGGIGAYATCDFAAGSCLASIPACCVLTSKIAKQSALGRACQVAAAEWNLEDDICTDAVLLWIYMAVGRKDPTNPFHAYLSTLPAESPDPACWSTALRHELAATPAGAAVEAARSRVNAVFESFASRLPAQLGPALVPAGSLLAAEELLWARGMCLSRSA
jgi:hypothetical protein